MHYFIRGLYEETISMDAKNVKYSSISFWDLIDNLISN